MVSNPNCNKGLVQVKRQRKSWRLDSHVENSLLWIGLLLIVLCLFLICYADQSIATYFRTTDLNIFRFIKKITFLGQSSIYLIPLGVLCLSLRLAPMFSKFRPHKISLINAFNYFLFLFTSVAISGIVINILKVIFGRSRPRLLFEENSYGFSFFEFSSDMLSFPSGHANTIFALAVALFLLRPRWWFFYFPAAIIIAASRIITGSHYLSDVIIGSYLGLVTSLYVKNYFDIFVFSNRSNGSDWKNDGRDKFTYK